MRDYGKVFTSIWASPDFRAMSEDGRALALYLLTCPHGTISGTFRLPDGYVCEDLQWAPERVAQGFAELLRNGFANRCETTKWVWVIKFLEWNPPENPNQRKSAAKQAAQIADQCSWKRAFMRDCGEVLAIKVDDGSEPLSNPCETLSQPGTGTGTEEVSEEANASSSSAEPTGKVDGKPGVVPCPYQRIVEAYHELLPSLPGVRLMSESRQKAMRKLWVWVLTSKRPEGARRAESADEAMEWIRAYFARAAENDFLMGRTPRNGEHSGWTCDFDFLLTERGMRHVIEKTEARAA